MNTFLNKFSHKMNKASPQSLTQLKSIFTRSIDIVHEHIPRAFRLVRALNAAVFDSAMVGLAKRIEAEKRPVNVNQVRPAYDALLANAEYRAACERATATEENVKTRLRLAIAAFATI